MDNEFYYTRMNPNDIYTAADQYLNRINNNPGDEDISGDVPKQEPTGGDQQPPSQPPSQSPSQPPNQFPSQPPREFYYQHQKQSPVSKVEIEQRNDLLHKDVPVIVAEVINPGNFYLVVLDKEHEYISLKQRMKRFYEVNRSTLPIIVDQYYAAKLDSTNEYGRVKILNSTSGYCCCLFVDEGVSFYIAHEKIYPLDEQFKRLPPRSIKAGLLGLSTTIWPFSTTSLFKQLAENPKLITYIQSVEGNVHKCILISNDNGINVNEEIGKILSPGPAGSS